MGMDINSGKGVIATTEQMINLLKDTSYVNTDLRNNIRIERKRLIDAGDMNAAMKLEVSDGTWGDNIYYTFEMMTGFDDQDTFKPLIDLNHKFKEFWENPTDEEFSNVDFAQFAVIEKALKECIVIDEYNEEEKEIRSSDELCWFWNNVLHFIAPELPKLSEITIFSKGADLEGCDVPQGVVCFVFGSQESFEKKLTEKGEALKDAIGHCDESEWTTVSY